MRIAKAVIDAQPERVRQYFLQWSSFMEQEIEFWKIPGNLDIHTQGHCERVLMHALRIGEARHVTDRQLTALAHASVFHDTRRKDNYLDTGHGARAADYYKDFCQAHEMAFLPEAYTAIWYHDRDDELGRAYITKHCDDNPAAWVEVYACFKDADALDRYRLGEWCLDEKFLRTPESKTMMSFALQLVRDTVPPDELAFTYAQTNPFRPKK